MTMMRIRERGGERFLFLGVEESIIVYRKMVRGDFICT